MVMMMNGGSVDVICRETIKPSSPTPHTHKTFQLSFLDQLLPTFYVPIIFFHKPDIDDLNMTTSAGPITQNLKTSFSKALSLYYPLAGQLDPQNLTVVHCNDAGAQFVEARAHGPMDDVIQDPQMDQLLKYLPFDPSNTVIGGSGDSPPPPPLLGVQVTFFDCGGMAVGVCSAHLLTDAISLVAFIASWAETCRQGQNGKLTPNFALARHFPSLLAFIASWAAKTFSQGQNGKLTPNFALARHFPSLLAFIASWVAKTFSLGQNGKLTPNFALARHFPPRDLSGLSQHSTYAKSEKVATKRFVFDKEKLAALRRVVTSAAGSTVVTVDPTRVELVSAFIWKIVIEGSEKNGQVSRSAAWHVVNLRPRIKSLPILENVFGNCILKQFVFSEEGGGDETHELVSRLRNGLKEVDEEFIWRAAEEEGYLKEFRRTNGAAGSCGFSSWSRLPVYEMDFGEMMGKPVWVCPASIPEKNFGFLMGTKDGVGIELWVTMSQSALQLVDIKFQQLAKSDDQA